MITMSKTISKTYEVLKKFSKKYPGTIAWRIKSHARVVDEHLSYDEKILYAFAAQNSDAFLEIFNTYAIVFTDKRIILARKRLFFGYFFKIITPDMYNDLSVNKGLIWGRVIIDTVKEVIYLKNIDADALPEIASNINEIMIEQKKLYGLSNSKENTKH